MNGKQAKRLRKDIVGEPTEYTYTYHKNTRAIQQGDGSIVYYSYTAKLKNGTARYNYKQAKKQYNEDRNI